MSSVSEQTYPLVFSADSPMLAVYRTLERVRETPTTVLVEGESGTGKDGLAQWLHYNSPRKDSPCIKIDFSSLPEELVESELFGHERGAFTGAVSSKLENWIWRRAAWPFSMKLLTRIQPFRQSS